MKDFIMAALPWMMMGIALAVFAVSYSAKKKRTTDEEKTGKSGEWDNHGLLGMLLGMSLGLAVGSAGGHAGTGISTGMLLGLALGMCVKKED